MYKIEFRYKAANVSTPGHDAQDEEIEFGNDEYIPIPAVGDSVAYLDKGRMVQYKVVSRHFVYETGSCEVNIVVTDMSKEELVAREKL